MSQCVNVIISQARGPVFKFLSSMLKSGCSNIYQQPQWWQWWRWKCSPLELAGSQHSLRISEWLFQEHNKKSSRGGPWWPALASVCTCTGVSNDIYSYKPHTYILHTHPRYADHMYVCIHMHTEKHIPICLSHKYALIYVYTHIPHTHMYYMYSHILKGGKGNCGDVKENGPQQ